MANVSSFYGTLKLCTNNNPWTPEGYLLAYTILDNFKDGYYNFVMDEVIAENSATFLANFLEDPDAEIGYFGNGRWSASNNFESFNAWSIHKYIKDTKILDELYSSQREKLLKLMYDNQWYFAFDFVDEESGLAFITQATVYISSKYEESTYNFSTETVACDEYDYNLKNYCLIIEENRPGSSIFWGVIKQLFVLLNISSEYQNKFVDFIVENDLDVYLHPYDMFDSVEDIPEIIRKNKEIFMANKKEGEL